MRRSDRREFPAILPAGLHPVDLNGLRQLCVTAFPGSKSRARLLKELEDLIQLLRNNGLAAEVWIDGSFVTRKPNPRDIGVVVFAAAAAAESENHHSLDLLVQIDKGALTPLANLDVFAEIDYPVAHALHWRTLSRRRNWEDEFGHDRYNRPKGFLTMRIEP